MIGVIASASEHVVVEEFFQLFKTPWELFQGGRTYDVVIATTPEIPEVDARLLLVFGSRPKHCDSRHGIIAGSRIEGAMLDHDGGKVPTYGATLLLSAASGVTCVLTEQGGAGVLLRSADRRVLRLGYDLFEEIRYLLVVGQPIERAQFPAIDIHIAMIRDWILDAGIALVEIPPVPSGRKFAVCLTHDIDFIGIRRHKFDHTMWGFLYRATVGALRNFGQGRIPFARLLESLRSVASLPLVYLGLARDFWLPFEWYLRVETGLPSTYFVIPFKARPGEKLSVENPQRRACAYDIADIPEWTTRLPREGYEVGVHGIDAWHSVGLGKEELKRILAVTAVPDIGIRLHWLLFDDNTYRVLEECGFAYDSTAGYNETPGYRNGTGQVFRPLGCRILLELPMHIQDGALFLPKRLNLSESAAWNLCESFMLNASLWGGVLTVLWHDRSHASERFWGDFYIRLLQELKSLDVWFGTAAQVVDWFRKRREVTFQCADTAGGGTWLEPRGAGAKINPPLTVRIHRPGGAGGTLDESRAPRQFVDWPWSADARLELDPLLRKAQSSMSPSHSAIH